MSQGARSWLGQGFPAAFATAVLGGLSCGIALGCGAAAEVRPPAPAPMRSPAPTPPPPADSAAAPRVAPELHVEDAQAALRSGRTVVLVPSPDAVPAFFGPPSPERAASDRTAANVEPPLQLAPYTRWSYGTWLPYGGARPWRHQPCPPAGWGGAPRPPDSGGSGGLPPAGGDWPRVPNYGPPAAGAPWPGR
jgi:hypothetical protein